MANLYISTFGDDVSWIKNGIPIEVGAAVRDTFKYELRDNTGDNISDENPYFGELTGLYWIWKNVKMNKTDIVGFCHYNKCLDISDKMVEMILRIDKSHSWICLEATRAVPHDYPEDIVIIEKVLMADYPSYYEAWKTLYDSNGASVEVNCNPAQLFYTTKEELDLYCEFLFGVLFKTRVEIGNVDRPVYHKRYCAFLGERLLSVYILANSRKTLSVKKRTNVRFARKIIHSMRFLSRVNVIEKWYKKIRKSDFFEKHLNEEGTSWSGR